jgi:hypothetical protein
MSSIGDLLSSGVSGTEWIGKIYTYAGFVFCLALAVAMFVAGGIEWKKKYPYTAQTSGVVKKATCTQGQNNIQDCDLEVSYFPKGSGNQQYLQQTANMQVDSSSVYNAGQVVKVAYDPNNVQDAVIYTRFTPKVTAILLIVGALLLIGGAALAVYLVRNSNAFAFLEGASAVSRYL